MRLKGFVMKYWLFGCMMGISVLGMTQADNDFVPVSGYAPFKSVNITYKNGRSKTLKCNTTGTHYNHISDSADENILVCGEMKVGHLLFTKAAWLVVDSDISSFDGRSTQAKKYLGKDCAIFQNGKDYSSWRCRYWQKLRDVGEAVSGRKQAYPQDGITYYQARIPKKRNSRN